MDRTIPAPPFLHSIISQTPTVTEVTTTATIMGLPTTIVEPGTLATRVERESKTHSTLVIGRFTSDNEIHGFSCSLK